LDSGVALNVGSIPAGNGYRDFVSLGHIGNVRASALPLIRFLPKAHPYGLRLCRSTPVSSIPAGNGSFDFVSLRQLEMCVHPASVDLLLNR
jgi:hypothetical protein